MDMDMDMEVKTALDKFYECFDNPEKDDLFFDYEGLSCSSKDF